MRTNPEPTGTAQTTEFAHIPVEALLYMKDAAAQLPKALQGEFVRRTCRQAMTVIGQHPNTLVLGTGGLLAGTVIDSVLHFSVFGMDIALTGGKAGAVGALLGVGFGFYRDQRNISASETIQLIVRQELKRALASKDIIEAEVSVSQPKEHERQQ